MADSTLNQFLASGTAAQRAAFTPTPPSPANAPPDPGYFWYETDTDSMYAWDSVAVAWVLVSGGSAVNDGDTLSIGLTFPNTGLHILDTNASHDLIIAPGSNITADRTLTLTTGDADRTLTLTGNATLNQAVDTTADPAFNTVKINDSDDSNTLQILTSSNLTADRTLTLVPGDASRTLTLTGDATLNQAVDTTADPAFNTLKLNDSNDSHTVQILMGSDISADRTLTVTTGDANRTLTLPVVGVVGITIDGGGSAITTGVKGYVECPYAGTIVSATLVADVSGAIVIDVWKDTYANFPPVDADSITSATPPTITASGTNSQDTTLSSWTTSVAAGDVFGFNVDSCTSITRVTLTLKINRT